MTMFLSILGISLLIILHELGHYGVAKLCNMRVIRFSLGFGPVVAKWTFSETQWQLACVPLGGFVQVDGMGPKDTDVYENDDRNYRNRPLWQRAAVIAAGPLMNWLITAAIIGGLAMSVGYEKPDAAPRLGEIVEGSAASDAGLSSGDLILRFDGQEPHTWDDIVREVRTRPGQSIPVQVERDDQRFELQVTPKDDGKGKGVLGVRQSVKRVIVSLAQACVFAV
ncbi:MAG: site-2 protease family protein, partial [Clostridia bacterium]|nr:site-2 protease family protein [Deltaproteobacteria bacterium]